MGKKSVKLNKLKTPNNNNQQELNIDWKLQEKVKNRLDQKGESWKLTIIVWNFILKIFVTILVNEQQQQQLWIEKNLKSIFFDSHHNHKIHSKIFTHTTNIDHKKQDQTKKNQWITMSESLFKIFSFCKQQQKEKLKMWNIRMGRRRNTEIQIFLAIIFFGVFDSFIFTYTLALY